MKDEKSGRRMSLRRLSVTLVNKLFGKKSKKEKYEEKAHVEEEEKKLIADEIVFTS